MGAPDKNYISYANCEVGEATAVDLIPPFEFLPFSDTLKFSNARNGSVTAQRIYGGDEDCADFNNGSHNIKVWSDSWRSGGKYAITIKGGCRSITVGGTILKHGSEVDVDLDNYSDQNHAASQDIRLDLATEDGSAVRWRSLKGCRPVILNPEQRYECIRYLPWIVGVAWDRFYWLLKLVRICK